MKLKEWLNVVIIIGLLSFSLYRYKSKTYSTSRIRFLLDTQIEISVISKDQNVFTNIEEAFKMIEFYDEIFSYFNPNSLLYQINNSDSLKMELNDDLFHVLKLAEELYHLTEHLYDVSIAPLLDIWDFYNGAIPEESDLTKAKENIGFEKIVFDEKYIYIPSGMKLTLGSISKGYIIDKVIDFLKNQGVLEVFVNAGGDIRFFSHENRKWTVGIQHPRNIQELIATLKIPDMAVVTSGDYERYFETIGERYHHILNPKTGFPAKPTISVTIMSQTAFLADALSTAAFVMNPMDAIELINSFPDTEGIIYYYDTAGQILSVKTDHVHKWIINEIK